MFKPIFYTLRMPNIVIAFLRLVNNFPSLASSILKPHDHRCDVVDSILQLLCILI